jgi:hypothetical protein
MPGSESRRVAGILLVVFPTVLYGGVSLLMFLINRHFFFSLLSPHATEPNGFIYLAYVGALVLGAGLLTLGIGLLRNTL